MFSGDLLDTCRDLSAKGASNVSSVTVTQKGDDGWAGQYIRIILDDHSTKKLIFRCELGLAWIKESEGRGERTFDCTQDVALAMGKIFLRFFILFCHNFCIFLMNNVHLILLNKHVEWHYIISVVLECHMLKYPPSKLQCKIPNSYLI